MTNRPTDNRRTGRARAADIEGRSFTRNRDGEASGLADMIAYARTAVAPPPGRLRPDGEFVYDSRMERRNVVSGTVGLRALLPDLMDSAGRLVRVPAARPAMEARTVEDRIRQSSRVLAAGAHLIELPEPDLRMAGPEPVLVDEPGSFVTVEPAPFEKIELVEDAAPSAVFWGDGSRDQGEVSTAALPWSAAEIDRRTLTQRAVKFEMSRKQLKARRDGELESWALFAIALGLGRAVDAELLSAIEAANPDEYSHTGASSPAAKGLRFDELRAIVGRFGTFVEPAGAFEDWNASGRRGLTVRGTIPAEFSPDAEKTIIGAFTRAAVVITPEIDVLMERTRAGGLRMACWAGFQALLPDVGFFWDDHTPVPE